MSTYEFFWNTMELCDWMYEGDDDRVLLPVIQYLAKQGDDAIFQFDDIMLELLCQLDTEKLAEQCEEMNEYMGDDSFLYSRCVALINGPEYYKQAKSGKQKDMWNMEFESILYVPGKAWAMKHSKTPEDYPHFPSAAGL